MDDKAIAYIGELAAPRLYKVAPVSGGPELPFSSKVLHGITPNYPATVDVYTLQGFIDAIDAELENFANEGVLAHVVSPTMVELIHKVSDEYGHRKRPIRATLPKAIEAFKFGQWHDPESFTISVQANFQRSLVESSDGGVIGDTDYVLRIASHITAEASTLAEDDGISQNVTVKQGIALKAQEQMRARVLLSPFRTFPEIDQPLSTFLFRVRHVNGDQIQLALFEADGGRWRIAAAQGVASFLSGKLPDTIKVIR